MPLDCSTIVRWATFRQSAPPNTCSTSNFEELLQVNAPVWHFVPRFLTKRSNHSLPTLTAATPIPIALIHSLPRKIVGEIFPLPHTSTAEAISSPDDESGETSSQKSNPADSAAEASGNAAGDGEDNPWKRGVVETPLGRHQIAETYRCADDHKCYAINAPPYQVFEKY